MKHGTVKKAADVPAAFLYGVKNFSLVGAGTVLDEPSAARAIHAGAGFIFAPNLNIDVVRAAKR
ncbi:hypothetical protein [Alteribacillus persepolensis]|uniref:hypothetical protein n=1 Tax=Alteribacillus persepolensis TaxID=568899 RepID=UPI00158725A4|nr:hypothetical protein [Alteribacillus persepolensis]